MQDKTTACPLDCYDACGITYENETIKPLKYGYTNGFLCPHMNHFQKYETILSPRYKGREIDMNEALNILTEMLSVSDANKILCYRGSGNFALMQEVSEHFFASLGATLTKGSLCDGAGEAGVVVGRGSNRNMPISQIAKSEVVIFWGRNPHTSSSHLLPIIKDKKIIVIDPIKTKIAKMADLYVCIRPRGDFYLAMLLSRFLHIDNSCDEEYLDKYASDFEEFYELTQTIRIKATLDEIGVSLGEIGKILELIKDRKVAIICGTGVQKYRDGADILRAIDAFSVMLGLFGKEGCGVAYLGNSKEGIKNPFNTNARRVSKVDTSFGDYSSVFFQASNPLSQMPNTQRVKESLSHVKNIIYFGLYENETSKLAHLVIPAKSFLAKNDVRTSYSHNAMMFMPKVTESHIGISEYELSLYLCKKFNIDLKSEEFYLEHFKSFASKGEDGFYYVNDRDEIPYKNGFDVPSGKFEFLQEYDATLDTQGKLHLLTPKSHSSLNSQFRTQDAVYLNSFLGFKEDETVCISSVDGSVKLKVKIDDELRDDCVLVYSGTKGVNNLTTSKPSYEGDCASYQENMVEVFKI